MVLPFIALASAIMLLWGKAVTGLDLILCGVMYVLTAFGLTMGFHRLFTHRSFKCGTAVTACLGVAGSMAADLPPTSIFRTVNEASAFFEPGVVGYSATASGQRLDGVVLKTHSWSVAPLSLEGVSSSYFADERVFPAGTVSFDCALIMRNIAHEWLAGEPIYL